MNQYTRSTGTNYSIPYEARNPQILHTRIRRTPCTKSRSTNEYKVVRNIEKQTRVGKKAERDRKPIIPKSIW